MLLLRTEGGRAFLIDAQQARKLPYDAAEDAVREWASAAATAWWRERDREERTRQRLRGLVDFGEALSKLTERRAVFEALLQHAGRIVGAAGGAIVEHRRDSGEARIVFPPELPPEQERAPWPGILPRPGVRSAEELGAVEDGGVLAVVARILRARFLVHFPLFDDLVLLLAERRSGRVFGDQDWEVLQGMSRATRDALERIELREEIRRLRGGGASA